MTTLLLLAALCQDLSGFDQPYTIERVVAKAEVPASLIFITQRSCDPCRRQEVIVNELKAIGWIVKPIAEGGPVNISIVDLDDNQSHVFKYGRRDENGLYSAPQWILVRENVPLASEIGFKTRQEIVAFAGRGQPQAASENAPTPLSEVRRILAVLAPQPHETFVDYGCGDGRWLIEAVRGYGCRAVGVELDPSQAERARQAIAAAGLTGRAQVIEGDATAVDVDAHVGVAYLYDDVLARLKPKLLKLSRFATYMHRVDGVTMEHNGDAWVWRKPVPVQQQRYAWYGGQAYSGRVCGNPRCAMCNAIARQLGQ